MSVFKKLLFSFFCGLFFNAAAVEWAQDMAGAEDFFVKDDFNEESLCPSPKKPHQDFVINEFADFSHSGNTGYADGHFDPLFELKNLVQRVREHHKKNNLVYCPKTHLDDIRKQAEECIQSRQYRSSDDQYELLRECFIDQIRQMHLADSRGKLIEEQLKVNYLPELWFVLNRKKFKKTDSQELKKYFESICISFFSSKQMQDAFTIARGQKEFTSLSTHQSPREIFQEFISNTPKP